MDIWVDVFKTGEQTDKVGNTRVWTEQDLDLIVEKYNEQEDETKKLAPLQYGHDVKDGDPALGWVSKLKRVGGVLQAKFSEMKKELVNSIKDGSYKFTSIGLRNDGLLRHIAILGAEPPAVGGLKPLNEYFSADDEYTTWNFAEPIDGQIAEPKVDEMTGFELAKDYIKEQYGTEDYDEFIRYLISKTKKTEETQMSETKETVEMKTTNFAETEEYKTMQNQIKELENKNAEMQFNEFFNGMVADGLLTPATKEDVKSLLSNDFNFSEAKMTRNELFKKIVETFPKPVQYLGFAEKGKDIEVEETDVMKALKEKYAR